ncbi:helix-turn-helix domain-containing protein [Nocardiopsis alkaliphila]|uniref:helix-turn-helix domain-containing protein n=1 Tax=Nocardiopsis alkaliphila TaxID=225762 RepID=UPI0013778931|nr:helix-turn-helix domain-containing protein [Nocardiopsis alkaliphila]
MTPTTGACPRTNPGQRSRPRDPYPAALTDDEWVRVLELMNSEPYADLPPAQICARKLDEGRCHCSVSTMYRILRTHGQAGESRHPPAQDRARTPRGRTGAGVHLRHHPPQSSPAW